MAKPTKRSSRLAPVKRTTLKDVAKLCDVTPMTVSKFLNNKGGVSKETAERIQLAIRQLNYTPNLLAKSLRMNKTSTFGVVMSDSSQLLLSRMLKGIDDEAFAAGYSIIMANTNQNPERERECITTILNKRIDGIILAAPKKIDIDVYNEIRSFGIPMVLLMRSSPFQVDCITSDNRKGGGEAVEYLAGRGARKIHYIGLPADSQSGNDRIEGYRQALGRLGIGFDPALVRHAADSTMEAGREAAEKLLADGFAGDAICCGCDLIAVGVLQALARRGINVPDQVRVIGFDDIDMMENLAIPLTTMRQQVSLMGRQGVRMLLDRLAQPALSPVHVQLPCELVVRVST